VPSPIIVHRDTPDYAARLNAVGDSFSIHEWSGSGPPHQHVHHADDEAWHVLEGTLRFTFGEEDAEAGAGSTVFVPAGVPHTYEAIGEARYLIVLTPRLRLLIAELQAAPPARHAEIYRKYDSELIGDNGS
jgi:uncharacterized protein YjlB